MIDGVCYHAYTVAIRNRHFETDTSCAQEHKQSIGIYVHDTKEETRERESDICTAITDDGAADAGGTCTWEQVEDD